MSILKASLCDYSDGYMLVKRIITAVGAEATEVLRTSDRNNKQAIFKNCAPFTDL